MRQHRKRETQIRVARKQLSVDMCLRVCRVLAKARVVHVDSDAERHPGNVPSQLHLPAHTGVIRLKE